MGKKKKIYGESPLMKAIKTILFIEAIKKIRSERVGMTYGEIKSGCMSERKLDTTGIENVGKSFTLYKNGEFKSIMSK